MALHLSSVLLLSVITLTLSEVRVKLTAAVGSSITFPAPVKEKGFFLFGQKNIASVYNGVFEIEEPIYTNRINWSSSTGHFSLSDLQKSDSGLYSIDSKKGNVFSKYYELKLYEPVSLPVVSSVNVSADGCTLQCSVTLTEQTTLSWFRGEQHVDSSSSAVLRLTVQRRDSASQYKCVAQNPIEEKTVRVNITKECQFVEPQPNENPRDSVGWLFLIPLGVSGLALAVFVTVIDLITERKRKREATVPLPASEHINNRLRGQCSVNMCHFHQ